MFTLLIARLITIHASQTLGMLAITDISSRDLQEQNDSHISKT